MSALPTRRPGFAVTPAADGFLVGAEGSSVLTWLNRTGLMILELCTGANDAKAIALALAAAFDLAEPPEPAVRRTLGELAAAGLIDAGDATDGDAAPHVHIALWAPWATTGTGAVTGLAGLLDDARAAGIATTVAVDHGRSLRVSRSRAASSILTLAGATHLLLLDATDDAIDAVRRHSLGRLVASPHGVIGIPVPVGDPDWDRVRTAASRLPELTAGELDAYARSYDVTFGGPAPVTGVVDGFTEARHCGSRALLVRRSALEQIAGSPGVRRYRGRASGAGFTADADFGFFDPASTSDGLDLDEDLAFCERWRAVGGRVMADVTGPFRVSAEVAARVAMAAPA